MAVAIITDSASNMGLDLLGKYNVDMVSLNYEMNGETKLCFDPERSYEEHGKEFYNALRGGANIKTSLASPSVYYDLFKKHLDKGEDIIYFSISSKLSGSLNSARNAKEMIAGEYPDRTIECVDSLSASFGEAIIVIEAAKLAMQGKSVQEILDVVEPIRLSVRNEFTVDDLTYLQTGGRIQSLVFMVANVLGIKPMLRASREATIELVEKVRGRKKSLSRLIETVTSSILNPEEQTLYVAHCDCEEEARFVANAIKEKVPALKDVYICMYDFCTGAHVGPGTIALFYQGVERP